MPHKDNKQPVPRKPYKLIAPHRHGGVDYDAAAVKAGVEIELTDSQAATLKKAKKIA